MTRAEFVAALNEKFGGCPFELSTTGRKFTRVTKRSSAYCFLDADGNIYKPASWATPAKGVRSTLASVDMTKVDEYGSWLYRCR
jgi:hypothetical protein